MSQELPKAYDPALIEEKWANFWVAEKIFDVPTPSANSVILSEASQSHRDAQSKDPEGSIVSTIAENLSSTSPRPSPFVQLLPPPNVTGRLHIGHMLEHTQMDILTRWHRMAGDTAVWVPGTDHAGIATQMMVERQLASEGKSRTDFTREEFTARVWQWKQEYGSAITDQMKRLGASVDWSREYFTMDDRLSIAVREAFVRLYEQGLIYRGAYIVNWDPILGTAVSDLEVETEERPGHLYYIRYDLADAEFPHPGAPSSPAVSSPAKVGGSITIATTRPETLLGDTAVVVNPTDERYTHLIGKTLLLPLVGREIPLLADDWAQPEFGTGAVKVTPAHDPNDFAIGQRHNLPAPSIMDAQARIALAGSPYDKLDRFEARKQIVRDLEAAGHLVKIADHTLTLPISQRTGAVIEPRLSMQWFLAVNKAPADSTTLNCHPERSEGPASPGAATNTSSAPNSIAANAIAAVREGHITFTPENNTRTYMEWMTNIHDWCISRQLWWGHRIPAWHCSACGKITVSRDAVTACSGCGITDIKQETDVLDTWFSSGLLPFTVFGWPGTHTDVSSRPERSGVERPLYLESALTPDLAAFYPTQQLVTGFDILFFWVARMIMLGCHFMLDVPLPDGSPRTLADAVPFRNVYIHALVRDADRQKISKTKGNVIDPIEVVTKYGTDAVRFTLAAQASPGTDIAFNEARTEGYRAFANKIWNAARFLQMNIDRAREAGYTVTLNNSVPLQNSVISTEAKRSGETPVFGIIPETPTTPNTGESALKGTGFSPSIPNPNAGGASAPEGTSTTTTTPLETRWILSRLSTVAAEVDLALTGYRFDEAANAVYQFFWGEFCDWYLELVKLRLNFGPATSAGAPSMTAPSSWVGSEAGPSSWVGSEAATKSGTPTLVAPSFSLGSGRVSLDSKNEEGVLPPDPTTALTLNALVSTFEAALRLLSPFMPFLTEELWHALYASIDQPSPAKSIALTRYPQAKDFPSDPAGVEAMNLLQELIVTVRGLRKELGVPEKEATPIQIFAATPNTTDLAQQNADMLARQARVASVEIVTTAPTGNNTRSTATFDVAVIYERQIDVPAERERLTKDLAKYNKGIEAANKQLSNEGFTARAPAAIIEGLKKQFAETTALKEKAEAALAALPSE